ncbi:MAG: hypothetical protein GWO41_18200, partial [candidate division Zixibacteria bacterium]|nr:hypothetical protein [candidate division Zixibacteria bacterium]NIT54625.1 hypothetical protein [candidate division Zixibacteria bacterium]NIU17567.1 hypothetical protein [candidate division Zixibacteria bacterium]NIW43146.1 hypothetical protein [candidate division Zixibacteria bacterium]NIX55045.1 hypothetical protein [candidate division Zixibacteria bacterium]
SGDSLKVSHHDTGTEETITDIGFEGKCGILRFNPNILKRILTEHGDVVEFSYESESISETGTLNVVAVEDQDNEKYN